MIRPTITFDESTALDRVVAIERHGESGIQLFMRGDHAVHSQTVPFQPWLLATKSALNVPMAATEVQRLAGSGALAHRFTFRTWGDCQRARLALRDAGVPTLSYAAPAEQYLIAGGSPLFAGMTFGDLVRAQIDIETTGLDPNAPDARVLIMTAAINGVAALLLRGDEMSEVDMLQSFSTWMRATDPDTVEGHNIFNFDLPYLVERARQLKVALAWGRDGSSVLLGHELRFKAGARTIPYQSAHVYGRHLIDTYQQIQRYDVAGLLESYALKPAVRALGLERVDRTHIDSVDIAAAWSNDRTAFVKYAVDDVLDVNTLSELTLPTEFYQCGVVPGTLQAIASGGPGEKINDMLIRAYAVGGTSIPLPQLPRGYPGGHAELRRTGVFRPVVKCDVESLYPSIMLADRIAPGSDHLGVFLPMLGQLTEQRLHAKRALDSSNAQTRAFWNGMQASLKVLINSFYGYLGYSRGYFNDFDAAERVTLRGQDIIRGIVGELERRGAVAIEVDTDGVLLQPPPDIDTEEAELEFVEAVGALLPPRIRLAHDGRYQGMLSLRLKNYALLTYDDRVILKGSSLRSRRDEPFLRSFLAAAVPQFLKEQDRGNVRKLYLDIAMQIRSGTLPGAAIARTETITDQTFSSASNHRLATAAVGERVGERVRVYQRADGSLARLESFTGDADQQYLLRRLRDTAMRFRPLFDTTEEFDFVFPPVSLDTDINVLLDTPRTKQLSMFEN